MSEQLVYFENSFVETNVEDRDDTVSRITIDGYPSDPYAEGSVVVSLMLTKRGDIVYAWHLNAYRFNPKVCELLEESRKVLESLRQQRTVML